MSEARETWLRRRRELVCASDVAAILGFDPNRSAIQVYMEKLGLESAEETELMIRGREFEDPIAWAYTRQTGRYAHNLGSFEIQLHPRAPWLGATLDRVTGARETTAPLQLKMALGSARDWRDEPPLHYQAQVQTEIACFGSSWGAIAALVGPGPLWVQDIVRDDAFMDAALPPLEEFLWRVRRKEPPPVDNSLALEPMRRLYAGGNGRTVELGDDAGQEFTQWIAAKDAVGHAESWAEEMEARLRARLGEATFGTLPGGQVLALKQRKGCATRTLSWFNSRRRRG